jgi:4-hydroxy-3-methylbut-2-enyl diphosphate reductase
VSEPGVNEILLAEPRGFCAGVDRAIEIVERALAKFGAPIYVRHEIVHNTYVVNDLKAKGAIFIEDLADVPPGHAGVLAHGVSKAVQAEAQARGFHVFDATCPLVTKVHVEVAKLAKEGYEFIMIGHKGHPEVEGTMGQLTHGIHLVEDVADVARCSPARPEAGRRHADHAVGRRRGRDRGRGARALPGHPRAQAAGHLLRHPEPAGRGEDDVPQVDMVIVVGSPTSSNSNRLAELAQAGHRELHGRQRPTS